MKTKILNNNKMYKNIQFWISVDTSNNLERPLH